MRFYGLLVPKGKLDSAAQSLNTGEWLLTNLCKTQSDDSKELA
jgi:hypothetical protein